jgi:hypothetical protein
VTVDFASTLQRLGTRAQYIRISGNGRNALDFHIAFYIGELAAKDPDAFFHIVSGDTGFAPLLQHLKDRKLFARQCKDIGEIPHIKAANSKTLKVRVAIWCVNQHSETVADAPEFSAGSATCGDVVDRNVREDLLVVRMNLGQCLHPPDAAP